MGEKQNQQKDLCPNCGKELTQLSERRFDKVPNYRFKQYVETSFECRNCKKNFKKGQTSYDSLDDVLLQARIQLCGQKEVTLNSIKMEQIPLAFEEFTYTATWMIEDRQLELQKLAIQIEELKTSSQNMLDRMEKAKIGIVKAKSKLKGLKKKR
jgi:ribosomal protein L37AE/L43A